MRQVCSGLGRACYLCRMKKKILLWIAGISCLATPVHAQFNTVVTMPVRCKVETAPADSGMTGLMPGNMALGQQTPPAGTKVSSDNTGKEEWVERYLSVCYPLRRIKINSEYGYRKDPFTGKRKFHNGIDLHARDEQVLAMMEGVVVKVGQDKTSGKYVILRHGRYTVSYCHLSRICTVKGATVRARDVVGITGSTGRSTGEHLHITCKIGGRNVNPLLVFNHIKAMQEECVAALARL